MSVTLDDALLVLLGRGPSSAYELWHEHARVLGAARRVDIGRVMTAVNRLERGGLVRVEPPHEVRTGSGNRRPCELTPAGHRRQAAWLCAVTPDTEVEDMYVRGMLAVVAADEETFTAFVEHAMTATRLRIARLDRTATDSPADRAGVAFDQEVARALALWLHQLPQHRAPASRSERVTG
ncbi:PadR family transcriptional regulator [Dactylosporangium sp. NPDC005572]|uniref:PadR family transcriptional regulator n=1 Tax=Dactylosporangium sp. NPDC005572 TaxID=3156889 RepID=UPI0033B76671